MSSASASGPECVKTFVSRFHPECFALLSHVQTSVAQIQYKIPVISRHFDSVG